MLRYSKYIMSNLGSATLFVASGLTCIVWLTQSLRFVDMIVNQGLDMMAYLYLTTMLLPSLLGFMLPFALAASAIYAYHKLSADSELVVLKSIGLSRWQLARPALWFAFFGTVFGYFISLYLLPYTYRQYKDMQAFARNNYAAVLLQEGVFNTPVDGLTVFLRERRSDGVLKGILVQDSRVPSKTVTMMAEEGRLIKTPKGPRFVLTNGNRQELNQDKSQLSFLGFDDYVVDISLFAGEGGKRSREAKERYISELMFPEASATEHQRNEYRAEMHQRLTWPLYNFVLSALVLVLLTGGEFNRRGNWQRNAVTLLVTLGTLAVAVGLTNIVIQYPGLTLVMYGFPLLLLVASLYVLQGDPLGSPVPSGPFCDVVTIEGGER